MATQSGYPDFTSKPSGPEIKDADPRSLVSETDSASVRESSIQDANTAHRNPYEANDAQPKKIRYSAPDGPRKRREFDGRDPLDYEAHEALAQYIAAPESLNEFKSIAAFAKHFKVTRATVYRWRQNTDVARRADWLLRGNKLDAQLLARREWPSVVAAMLTSAKQGNTAAAKFCTDLAWPEEGQPGSRPISSMTIGEACRATENSGDIPTWLKRQMEEERLEGELPKPGTDGK